MSLSRREFLIAMAAGVLAAGCAPLSRGPAPGPTAARLSGPTSSRVPADQVLPAPRPWRAGAGEVQPQVKARAARLIEAAGSWSSSGGRSAAQARIGAAGFDPGLVEALAALIGPEPAAVVHIRDAQYGGILADSASVLVVADQWRLSAAGAAVAGGTTLDVRLMRATAHWRVSAVYPAKPGPASAVLTAAARHVLSTQQIRLPHAALLDVRAGRVHDSVLGFLKGLSDRFVVDVSVLRSGHPLHVFGTSRASDHPRGRAVDVWALDSQPLVLPANHKLAATLMRLSVGAGAYNVGGPVALAGPAYFTDLTHHDHVHVGFSS